jgi:itaconate CoA-transferase
MQAPLDQLLVVSLEQAVAAPYCSRLLAEGGARVIKLERPEGDFARAYDTVINGDSAYFVWLNGDKESVAVDLAKDDDKALLRRMLARADVFVQNLKPGAVDRLGFGYDAVSGINPALVMCSISGYGLRGEYAEMKAYDALIQAETGLCSVTGPPGQPSKVGASICDIATGLTAYGEILKALIARGRDGRGSHLEVSLFGTLSEWMAVPLAYYEYAGKLLRGTGLDHAQICPYGAYATADGQIFLVVQNHAEWVRLCRDGLGRPELADHELFRSNVLRVDNREALRAEIEGVFTTMSRAAVAERLLAAGIACGSINDVSDLGRHPALERRKVVSSGQEATLVRRVAAPDSPARVPGLDEHGTDIRAEFS